MAVSPRECISLHSPDWKCFPPAQPAGTIAKRSRDVAIRLQPLGLSPPGDAATVTSTMDLSSSGSRTSALERPLAEGPLEASQREKVLVEWNRTRSDYPDLCIHQLFEHHAHRTPQAEAAVFQGESITYGELDHRASRLARHLRMCGVKPGVLVGLCVNRSLEMVVALLGILKAGGAYVPLDPAYPKQRLEMIVEDSQVMVLITEKSLVESVPAGSAQVVLLDSDWSSNGDEYVDGLDDVRPTDLAYVIYTSGSTGKPKGVQIEHRSVVNLLTSMAKMPGLTSEDTLLAVTTLSFDIAGLEIYLPLITGARLVIANRETTLDGMRLQALLDEFRVTAMQATPATWRLLITAGWNGNRGLKVLVGGEALPVELGRKLASRCASVWNLYGPTETTIWSAVYRVTGQEEGSVPIGRPIANTEFYILDSEGSPVPIGAEGELCIGGDGLARGYLNRPELTAEKFIAHLFSSTPARLYRTGDLARYRRDGVVEFLGRIDHQVKIRGFRIELGEIESILEKHSNVQQAVVVAQDDGCGDKRLVAYIVSSDGHRPAAAELRSHLRRQLPEYMIPAAFVRLDRFPQTPNGKVDRRALPAPSSEDLELAKDFVPPRDRVEKKLVELWEEVLHIRPIGVQTNIFELGVHSLQAAQLFLRISQAFARDLPISVLFKAPTIEQLAEFVRPQAARANFATLIPIQPNGSKPPFFCVHGGAGSTLFLHRLAHHLGPNQPFYGFESEGVDGRPIQHTSMEQIAAHYISEMRRVQSEGPYYIGGYCFGGLVAFEMAQQLLRAGQKAEVVAMFNAPLRYHRPTPSPSRVQPKGKPASKLKKFQQMAPRQKLRYVYAGIREKLTRKITRVIWTTRLRTGNIVCRCFLAAGKPVPGKFRRMYVHRMTGAAERRYKAHFYPGQIILFRGKGLYDNEPEMGWTGLAQHIEPHEIAGGQHRSRRDILDEPKVQLLARQLATCLERAAFQGGSKGQGVFVTAVRQEAPENVEGQTFGIPG